MSNNDEKRLRIRAFFFPLSKPEEPDDAWWGTMGKILFGVVIVGIILAIIEGSWLIGIISVFGGMGLGFLGDWLDSELLGITKKRTKYTKKKEERDNLLAKWGLTEDLVNQPKRAPIFQWLNEDMQTVTQRALHNLGLTKEELVRDPMVIYGPLFWTTYGIPDDELVTVNLTDGSILFSCYQLVVVCLSAERIATYSANFNFLRYAFLNEKSVEYLYQDIVSVSTEEKSTNYNLPNGKTMRRAQIFRLAVPSGDNIEVVINSPEIRDLLGGEPKLSNHDQSVRVIREMLRTKKG